MSSDKNDFGGFDSYEDYTATEHIAEGKRILNSVSTDISDTERGLLIAEAHAQFAAAQAIAAVQAVVAAQPNSSAADDMTDDELLASPVGTRVREILYGRLGEYAQASYSRSNRGTSAVTILGGIERARDFVYPEHAWDGFREVHSWDVPFEPTPEDQAELLRRIKERGGVQDHAQAERIAMAIADERQGRTEK